MDFQTHLHLGAWHASAQFGTTANPGVGLLARKEDYMLGAGVWRNSLKETAPYGFAGWQPLKRGALSAGPLLGATKYRSQAQIVGGLVLSYKHSGAEYHLLFTPRVPKLAPAAVELSVSF